MAFTRFNYEKCRVQKSLQQATGPGRYMLNVPGNAGDKPEVFNDPQLRMQKWGGNLMGVYNGHPIDIDSDLKNVGRKLSKYCQQYIINRPVKNNASGMALQRFRTKSYVPITFRSTRKCL